MTNRRSAPPRGRRRRGVTGRALILVGVLVLLVVVLAAPVHRYLATRTALSQAQQQRQSNQAELAQLQQQAGQWNDPAYIAQQARARLQFAMPGDTVYVVVPPNAKPRTGDAAPRDSTATRIPGDSWNERLWGSVRTADSSP
jgi:cell division protein FtsL